jgi:hypothetical protein
MLCSILMLATICRVDVEGTETKPFVRGVVVASDGRPIDGVTVYGSNGRCCPFMSERVETDNAGSFRLEEPVKVIHFWKAGFRPLAAPVQAAGELKAVLEKEASTDWSISTCPTVKPTGREVGEGGIRFTVPRGVKTKRQRSDEGLALAISPSPHSAPLLLSWAGNSGSPHGDDGRILESRQFAERWIKNNRFETLGLDATGETREGLRWRHAVFFSEVTASYGAVSRETSESYDNIINSACMD